MSKTNSRLAGVIGNTKPKPRLVAAKSVPTPDTTNRQGLSAYTVSKWHRLLSMLNTLKLQPQYYRTEVQTLKELQALIKECAIENPYLTCQCIVYSRCLGEGMRTISHAASVFVAPYLSGQEYGKRFYGSWNKREKKGGVIFRADDMGEIISGFTALNGTHQHTMTRDVVTGAVLSEGIVTSGTKLTNAMKKGFRNALENMDSYTLLKYKSKLIDVINLVHPRPSASGAKVKVGEEEVYTIDAIMQGMSVSANTWEVNQGEAGQIVAKAVKEGKLDEAEAKQVLTEAKSDNWKELLMDEKLGILAAIRNLRNILSNAPETETIDKLCQLVSNPKLILEGKIMPYQLDLANDIMLTEFNDSNARKISQALSKGYEASIPNLAVALPGNNVIMLDMSGSMTWANVRLSNLKGHSTGITSAAKASLIAATIAKATNCDVIVFGSSAKYVQYNPNVDVFTLAKQLNTPNMGGTNLDSAWNAAKASGKRYNRVFILSDNEVNRGNSYSSYTAYLKAVGNPYVYSVDLASYGSTVLAGDNVRYYYGYGHSMFQDIASSEFNPDYHLEKVKQVII